MVKIVEHINYEYLIIARKLQSKYSINCRAHNIALTQKSEPCVQLKVDMRPFAEASEDWEPPSVSPAAPMVSQSYKEQPTVAPAQHQTEKQETQTGFQGMIMNQVLQIWIKISQN